MGTTISGSNGQVEVIATDELKSPLADSTRERMHDHMLLELEEHSPEGTQWAVSPWIRIGAPVAAGLIVVGALTALTIMAGGPALFLGIMIVIALYGVAGYPQWEAARLRRIEHERFELKIGNTIKRAERHVVRHGGST